MRFCQTTDVESALLHISENLRSCTDSIQKVPQFSEQKQYNSISKTIYLRLTRSSFAGIPSSQLNEVTDLESRKRRERDKFV
jgi:hypothetical protein